MLYERYHQPLYRYCRSLLRDEADAQDAAQSAFAGAFAALRRGRRDAPLRPWLFRIAHNESVSVLRRRRPQHELSELSEGATASVEEEAEARARLAALVADLQELPERQRGALVMRELSGLSHEDVAIALGTTVSGAKQTIFAARRSLIEFSEGRAMRCEEIQRTISDADRRGLRGRRVRAHLRDCEGCAAFAAAIPARRADLRALAPPLPAAALTGALARTLGAGTAPSGAGAGGLAAGTAGKTVGMALVGKALAGAAILAAATIGAKTALWRPAHAARRPPMATRLAPAGPAAAVPHGATLRPVAYVGRPTARRDSNAVSLRTVRVSHARHARSAHRARPAAAARSARWAPAASGGSASRASTTGGVGRAYGLSSYHAGRPSTHHPAHTPTARGRTIGVRHRTVRATAVVAAEKSQAPIAAGPGRAKHPSSRHVAQAQGTGNSSAHAMPQGAASGSHSRAGG
jgi:RNA polymerase sigma factor (sigma-70 family)